MNRLTILQREGRYALCLCECGAEKRVLYSTLRAGYTKSCGCLQKERTSNANTKHGLRSSALWPIYRAMHTRCYNPAHHSYPWYGGKGIKVENGWHSIEQFVLDMYSGYQAGLTLDRIDPSKNYSKQNCRWLTKSENARRSHEK